MIQWALVDKRGRFYRMCRGAEIELYPCKSEAAWTQKAFGLTGYRPVKVKVEVCE